MSLELLTVFVVAPLAVLVCYDIAKKNARANVLMLIVATAELYGGRCRPTCHSRHPLPRSACKTEELTRLNLFSSFL